MSRENASSANILGQTWSLIICVVVQIWAFQVMASFQANVQCFFAKCHHQKHIFVWQRVHCKLYCLGLANRIKKDVDSLPSPHGLSDQTMIDWPQASSTRSAQTVTWPRVRPRRTPSTAVQAWEQVCPTLVLSQHNTDRVLVLVVLCLSSLN